MKMQSMRSITIPAMIAALYAVLCLPLGQFGFGAIQVRIAEALTLLPVFSSLAIPGVAVGCLVANIYGFFTGMNPLGFVDIFLGTAVTLLAAICTRKLRHIRFKGLPILAALPPILLNAGIIGGELTYMLHGKLFTPLFWVQALQVGIGQLISCAGLGLMMVWVLDRSGAAHYCFDKAAQH